MQITPAQISSLIEITEGDTARVLYDQLTLAGQYVNLTRATASLWWYDTDTSVQTSKAGTIVNAVSGSVSYQLTSDDVSEPGVKLLQWNVRFPTGLDLRLPTGKFIKLNVVGDLED